MQVHVYYDANLIGILSGSENSEKLVVEYRGQEISLPTNPDHARLLREKDDINQSVGRLGAARLIQGGANGIPAWYRFDAYPDQTLRRATELDTFDYLGETYNINCIGWRNETNPAGFLAPKGLIPGRQGLFVTDGTEGFEINIPYQFTNLCVGLRNTTEKVIHDFIANACRLHNTAELPRADGLSSHGAEAEELIARYLALIYEKTGG